MRRWIVVLAAAGLLVTPASAGAAFHLMSVQEVYPGSTADPASEFVELQMYSPGQSFVSGHPVRFYSASGTETASATFSAPVANGQDQRSILVATSAAVTQFGVAADLTIGPGLDPAGGAACFENIDCVSWGSFSGSLPSPAGTPEAAIPDTNSLCRSIAAGSPTALESTDDTNNSANDFLPTPPAPRNNAAPATGTPCAGDGGGGGGGGDSKAPQTTITKAPDDKTEKTKAKFKFKSNEPSSTFECKFDKKPFKDCSSPQTYKNLDGGKHKFQVKATDAAGNTDPTPAKDSFKVVG